MGSVFTFDTLTASWLFSNFYKDITNAISRYDYQEDEWTRVAGSTNYGPLAHIIPTQTASLDLNGNFFTSDSVAAYGSDYYVLNIASNVGKVAVMVMGVPSGGNYSLRAKGLN
ncbi:hypothetical protein [Pseudobacteroides cellulosolvens]|uniref:Uncharacterized protein n=1 Tax=Pseudobacteroides cellulosolvens ATCC 35603 = DSM 2933 TaxID=398512 RepID=A0A0L6JSI8_9FIRM|nr:hypothetical protein [Pseudobacteroides cellulosolvens]KNY28690.1 hypothetical protein Bccel_3964 [Pseudobacteroides cellulosolvens ATCC 35603 = DSM 2933]